MLFTEMMFADVVLPFFADAASNAAPDGAWISTAAIGALCTGLGAVLGKVWPTRVKAEVKRPVDSDDTYVTTGQCKAHRCALEKRIDEIGPALKQISCKIDANEEKAEKRAVDLHRRLDPVVEKVAANSAKVEVIEELARKATMGGAK